MYPHIRLDLLLMLKTWLITIQVILALHLALQIVLLLLSSQNPLRLITPDPSLLDLPPSLGATPTTTPVPTPPPSPTPQGTPTDSEMATLKERSVFFPSDKFDGRNKNLTKQHWQTFEDFCGQQKLYITERSRYKSSND